MLKLARQWLRTGSCLELLHLHHPVIILLTCHMGSKFLAQVGTFLIYEYFKQLLVGLKQGNIHCICILLIVECKAGYMKDTTTGECTICPKNTYSEDVDSTECKSCPTGEITTSKGSSRKQKCRPSE